MLRSANLLYLGATVVILLEGPYLERFWTSAEAWLAMRKAVLQFGCDQFPGHRGGRPFESVVLKSRSR